MVFGLVTTILGLVGLYYEQRHFRSRSEREDPSESQTTYADN